MRLPTGDRAKRVRRITARCLFLSWPLLLGTASDARRTALVDPEDGRLTNGVYANGYFDLTYPLPSGWGTGLEGPLPSRSGYYVLNAPVPKEQLAATMLISAQDMFFADRRTASAMDMAEAVAHASETGAMRRERALSAVMIAGHLFARVDIGGAALSRIVLATELRCHVLIFVMTAADPARLESMIRNLSRMSLPADAAARSNPVCVKDYATERTLVRKLEPQSVGPAFLRIPVRIIIDTDGRVKHVHVIRASPEQKKNIEEALLHWEFKPYTLDGHPVELETGLVFEFKPIERQRD